MSELSLKNKIPRIKVLQLDPKDNKVNYFFGTLFSIGDTGSDIPLPLAQAERIKIQVMNHESFTITSEAQLSNIQVGTTQIDPTTQKEISPPKVSHAEIAFGARFSLQSIPLMLEYQMVEEQDLPISRQSLPEFELERSYGFSKHRFLKMISPDLTPKQQVLATKIAELIKLDEILDPYQSEALVSFKAPAIKAKVLRGAEQGQERIIENTFFTIGREGDDIPLRHPDFEFAHFLVESLPDRKWLIKKLNPKSAGKIDGQEFENVVIDETSQLTVGDTCLVFSYKIDEELASSDDQFNDSKQFGEESVLALDLPLKDLKKIKIKGSS